jgi:two-component system sensor histidine kinase UhpB
MSLRFRLLTSIAAVLVVVLALGEALLCWRATNIVEVEMRASLAGADDIVHQALAQQGERLTAGFLTSLVASFNGQRHIRAALFDSRHKLAARSQTTMSNDIAPAWFSDLIGVGSQTIRIPLPDSANEMPNGVFELQTDPANEIAEAWGQAGETFMIMLLFCAGAFVAIYAVAGHSLGFFSKFIGALQNISDGNYQTDMSEKGPPEFASVARGFNRMVERLREYESKNRALQEQILTQQEEERAEVARDLHDEVGPYLFAVNVDADAILRLATQSKTAEIPERALAIREAVMHVQKYVKAILRQLRPSATLDFGLQVAISELTAFWQNRNPTIRFTVQIEIDRMIIDRPVEDAAYRIVQESISNAIRHGQPTAISISIEPRPENGISITVIDDGKGLRPAIAHAGTGLVGMAERARALNGTFDIADCTEGSGVKVSACLPCRARPGQEMELAN